MKGKWLSVGVAAGWLILVAVAVHAAGAETGRTFRGPTGSGSYDVAGLPISWSEAGKTNIRWKTSLSLLGWSSPIVWKDKVVVTGADPEKRVVWCFGTGDGKRAWETELPVVAGATENYKTDTIDKDWDVRMYAAGTPVTDGERVYVLFSNGQLAALNLADGTVVWNKAIGNTLKNTYGLPSALVIYEDSLIAVFQGEEQFIAAYDPATGKEKWKADRSSATLTSPLLIKTAGGKDLVVLLGYPDATAWDPATGKKVWTIDILRKRPDYVVGPSPVFDGRRVFVNCQNSGIYAIDPDKGEKVWGVEKLPESSGFSDGVSMIVHGGRVYQYYDYYLTCLNAETGEVVKDHELDEMASYASPIVNAGRLYLFTTRDALVLDADPAKDFPIVGTGSLGSEMEASPTISGEAMFIRTDDALYCIGE